MSVRNVLLLLLAFVLTGATVLLARGWINSERAAIAASATKVTQPKPQPKILVAKAALAVGQFVRPESLEWRTWPADGIAGNYVVEGSHPLQDFIGAVVRTPIAAGEPVTEGRVVSPGNSGFLAAVLEPGYRAVTVPVTATSGIAGFVFPGDRIDLILTHTLQRQQNGVTVQRRVSETVLHDIRVLAVDQKIAGKPGEAQIARTATLEVTPKQSEVIAVTDDMGKLSLSLRSLAREERDGSPLPDAAVTVDGSVRASSYTADSDVSSLLPPLAMNGSKPAATGGPAKPQVTVLRGGSGNDAKGAGAAR